MNGSRGKRFSRRGLVLWVVAVAALCTVLPGCASDPGVGSAASPAENLDRDVAYVGADACRPCHLQQAATYGETGMGRAFYPMTAEVAVEDFDGDGHTDMVLSVCFF